MTKRLERNDSYKLATEFYKCKCSPSYSIITESSQDTMRRNDNNIKISSGDDDFKQECPLALLDDEDSSLNSNPKILNRRCTPYYPQPIFDTKAGEFTDGNLIQEECDKITIECNNNGQINKISLNSRNNLRTRTRFNTKYRSLYDSFKYEETIISDKPIETLKNIAKKRRPNSCSIEITNKLSPCVNLNLKQKVFPHNEQDSTNTVTNSAVSMEKQTSSDNDPDSNQTIKSDMCCANSLRSTCTMVPINNFQFYPCFINDTSKYTDLLTENASFIDSPIHSLLEYHQSQRKLKEKQKSKDEKQENSNSVIINEINKADDMTDTVNELSENMTEKCFSRQEDLLDSNPKEPETFILNKLEFYKNLFGLLVSTVLTFSSIFLLEILTLIIRDEKLFVIYSRASTCLISLFISLCYFKCNENKRNSMFETLNDVNNDHKTTTKYKNDKNKEELKKLMPNLIESDSNKIVIDKPNFNKFIFSLCYVHVSILLSHFLSYLSLQQRFTGFFNSIEMAITIMSGIGVALFVKLTIQFLYFFVTIRYKSSYERRLHLSQSNKDNKSISSHDIIKNKIKNKLYKNGLSMRYQTSFIAYMILVKLTWLSTSGFMYLITYILDNIVLFGLFNKICAKSMFTVKCPISLNEEELFSWKNEISSRIRYLWSNEWSKYSNLQSTDNSTSIIGINKFFNSKNTTSYYKLLDEFELQSVKDIYLLAIGVTLIAFIVALLISFLLIDLRKTYNSIDIVNVCINQHDFDFEDNNIENVQNTSDLPKKQKLVKKFLILHLVFPVIFSHGFIKTLVMFELNRWHVSCLRGPAFLTKFQFYYGLSSTLSLLFLAMIHFTCRVKKNMLFAIIFIQQLTLLFIFYYWNPKNSEDLIQNSVYYVIIICFSICDNLLLVHNIHCIISNGFYMKLPILSIFIYGFSIYTLGTAIGYIISHYYCFTIKLFSSIILFLISSIVYAGPEIIKLLNINILKCASK